MNSINISKFLIWLGVVGLSVYVFGQYGLIHPLIIIPLLIILVWYLYLYIKPITSTINSLKPLEKSLIVILIFQWLIYLIGIFVPETGFDALWYHLPQAKVYALTGQVFRLKGLLYGTMPRLGEMYYTLGFLTRSAIIVKSISFSFVILFVLTSYHLARTTLTRSQSLLTITVVNSLYVVAWQASSGYVDLIRSTFELAALMSLMLFIKKTNNNRQWLISAGIFTGLSLGVKMQAAIALFAGMGLILTTFISQSGQKPKNHYRSTLLTLICFVALTLFVALPWYLDNYFQTSHPLYPTNLQHLQLSVLTHAGAQSIPAWITGQLLKLPLSPYLATFKGSSFLTPMILILLPLFLWQIKPIIKKQLPLLTYIIIYFMLWWFTPPPESRYALTLTVAYLLLGFWTVFQLPKKYQSLKSWTVVLALVSILINLTLRIGASYKYLPPITRQQSPSEYIESQTNDFNRSVIKKYHSDYYTNYPTPTK